MAPAADVTPVRLVVPTPALPRCADFDAARVEAYWSPLPWPDGRRWLRVQSASTPSPVPGAALVIAGCAARADVAAPGPGVWPHPAGAPLVLFGCVPEPSATQVTFTVDAACRLGAGRRTIAGVVDVVDRPAGERLSTRVDVAPPTPGEEQGMGRELVVWRTRAELPPWLAPHVPADFDFERFQLAGSDEGRTYAPRVVVATPATPPVRVGRVVRVEHRHPQPECAPCRGVYDPHASPPVVERAPYTAWMLPRDDGKVFFVEHVATCPPCTAP